MKLPICFLLLAKNLSYEPSKETLNTLFCKSTTLKGNSQSYFRNC